MSGPSYNARSTEKLWPMLLVISGKVASARNLRRKALGRSAWRRSLPVLARSETGSGWISDKVEKTSPSPSKMARGGRRNATPRPRMSVT